MKKLLSREELIRLIVQVNTMKTEQDEDDLIEIIEDGVSDPKISDYIFWSDMTPEQIADKALSYKRGS